MNYKEFAQKNKSKLIIVGIVLVIAIVFLVLYFNNYFVDEKYCDGVTIGCQADAERGCINELQIGIDPYFHTIYYCQCNTTDNVCEGKFAGVFADWGDEIEGSVCFDEKDCPVRSTFTKCLAENANSIEGKCTKWDMPLEGCNYYMINGKAKEICYK